MGNSAEAAYSISQPGVYYDVVPRVLRNVISYPFNQPFTSTATLAFSNSIPQITQGNEVMAFNYTAQSLSSWLEFEVFTYITTLSGNNAWVALFADYSPDALIVNPAGLQGTLPFYMKHYMMPVSLNPIRYSLRICPTTQPLIINYFPFAGRNQSRVTVKEWSGLSLNNTAP